MSREMLLTLKEDAGRASELASSQCMKAGVMAEQASRAEARFHALDANFLRAVLDEVRGLVGADGIDPEDLPDHLAEAASGAPGVVVGGGEAVCCRTGAQVSLLRQLLKLSRALGGDGAALHRRVDLGLRPLKLLLRAVGLVQTGL